MDTTTAIGLGLSAFMLLQNKKQQEQYAQEIQNIKDDAAAQEVYIDNKLSEMNTQSDEYIKKYISVYPIIELNSVTDNHWIGRFSICIENKSQDQTFLIFKEKAIFTLCSQRCTNFQPGMHEQYSLQPGDVVYADSTWQDKSWYSSNGQRTPIQNKLRDNKGKWLTNGELIADITLAFGTVGDYATKYVTWENAKGRVQLEDAPIRYYNNKGFNSVNEEW